MSGWTQLHVLASVLPWLGEMCINECAQVNVKGCMQQLKLYGAHQLHVTAGLGHGACLLLLASRQAVHTHNRDVAKTSIHSTTKQARVALCVTRIVHKWTVTLNLCGPRLRHPCHSKHAQYPILLVGSWETFTLEAHCSQHPMWL